MTTTEIFLGSSTYHPVTLFQPLEFRFTLSLGDKIPIFTNFTINARFIVGLLLVDVPRVVVIRTHVGKMCAK